MKCEILTKLGSSFLIFSLHFGSWFHSVLSDGVVQLTEDNFKDLTARYELVFINFYADWCRFSNMLAPVFEESYRKVLKEFPQPNQVLFAKVDCDVETTLSGRFHITKYPTLKTVMNGKVLKREYRGQRSDDAMVEYVRNQLKDQVIRVTSLSEFEKMDERKPALVAFMSFVPSGPEERINQEYNIFRKVATDLKDECNFYWVYGEASKTYGQGEKQGHVVFKPPRTRPTESDLKIYTEQLTTYDGLSAWATEKCIPLVREITFENAEELTEEGLPFVILFHKPEDSESVKIYTDVVHRELATETSVNFLTADGHKFAHPLHHLGKAQSDLPLIAIDSFRHMYLLPDFNQIKTPGKLTQFVRDLQSGKLHREFHYGPEITTKEQEDPTQNQVIATQPPESTFKKLAPSRNRYTLLRDEL